MPIVAISVLMTNRCDFTPLLGNLVALEEQIKLHKHCCLVRNDGGGDQGVLGPDGGVEVGDDHVLLLDLVITGLELNGYFVYLFGETHNFLSSKDVGLPCCTECKIKPVELGVDFFFTGVHVGEDHCKIFLLSNVSIFSAGNDLVEGDGGHGSLFGFGLYWLFIEFQKK